MYNVFLIIFGLVAMFAFTQTVWLLGLDLIEQKDWTGLAIYVGLITPILIISTVFMLGQFVVQPWMELIHIGGK